jgi:hypothetical protein
MDNGEVLYICPVCFRVCDSKRECHEHQTIECHTGRPGDARRKPLEDQFGNLVSRAPRWYLEARELIPAWTPVPDPPPAGQP